jgi:hypothetical protein
MKQQTSVRTQKDNTTSPRRGLLRHTAVRTIPEHEMPSNAPLETRFGHDFSQIAVRPSAPMVGQHYATSACPVFPRTCPFGGACHTCPAPVQTKLKVGQPTDKYEREADRVAEQVMRTPEPQATQKMGVSGWDQAPSMNLQRSATHQTAPSPVPPIVHEVLRSPGQPLDTGTRAFMAPRFGHDFSQVRIHADPRATETAQAIKARAFTLGRNVVFGEGQYAPETSRGRRLLAHELSHVVQQEGTEADWLGKRILRQETEEVMVGAAASAVAAGAGAVAPVAGIAAGAMAGVAATALTPLTFNVATTNLTPKTWRDRLNIRAGAASTRTNITIGGPPNSTIDIIHVRLDAPDYGHTHTNEPTGAMARRFKHGHLTNKANGQGRQYNDFQIGSEGKNRTITYHAPHAAGQVLLAARIRGRTDAAARRQVIVTTAVEGLQQYATIHPNEVLIGKMPHHGTNHWGTTAAITRMQSIVNGFRNAWVAAAPQGTTRSPDDAPTIQINDFSLEHGGLYDFDDNWWKPHETHRFGNNIDISRKVLINGVLTYLRPGNDSIGEIYDMLNSAIGVDPEDPKHWHVNV